MDLIANAIDNTKRVVPGYFENTVRNRLSGGIGSIYDQFETSEELEKALLSADWEETTHPSVLAGCRVFKANLPGRLGIIEIDTLPDDVELIADDSKSTGNVAMTVKGVRGTVVPETYLIIGKEKDVDVVYTFHPGEPVKPSIVSTSTVNHGSVVSKREAKKLGFDLAKIV